jgi:hypothetical protein
MIRKWEDSISLSTQGLDKQTKRFKRRIAFVRYGFKVGLVESGRADDVRLLLVD